METLKRGRGAETLLTEDQRAREEAGSVTLGVEMRRRQQRCRTRVLKKDKKGRVGGWVGGFSQSQQVSTEACVRVTGQGAKIKSLIASLLAEKHRVKGKSRLSCGIVTLQTMMATLAVTAAAAAAVRPGIREGSTRAGHMAKRAATPELHVSALNVKLNFLKLFRVAEV